ncbi:hypothetical protein [Streptomyces acidiscabies]|uniref:Lipoprotein n=1 Tax=Streptomyces acidiscabies TaxID=42234 RepID=A0AAP6EFF8_9ACTN|nr:hypothetical protein [Streptomyces acidiscabies]MBP5937143.1 hypothetical protein [Streptomyces sp. LBUM 1476]MBZ3914809.1 hypothetical protein [Streptomyces acidiscabies]MDX2960739.1 hypothetical protein [Streptomyces acidiscabies]MDX3020725.1 hypothetical protein [Streptomyces acidiscabies]MDX3792904.1 hypothetical protein [Streptomyces acidiscabies]
MRKIASSVIASAILAGGVVAVSAGTASAACPPDAGTRYTITNKSTVRQSSNLHSDWMYDNLGGTLTYNKTTTAAVNASGTATLGTEAGVIFAKASASFSVTVGKTWTKSSSWSYTIPAKNKAGKTKVRMTMFHESKKFLASKYAYHYDAHCKYIEKKLWSKWITAPVKKDSNVWGLEWK